MIKPPRVEILVATEFPSNRPGSPAQRSLDLPPSVVPLVLLVRGLGDPQAAGEATLPRCNGPLHFEDNLASCLALLRRESADLATVIECWPELPEAVRAGIVAMVKAASA